MTISHETKIKIYQDFGFSKAEAEKVAKQPVVKSSKKSELEIAFWMDFGFTREEAKRMVR
jgi:hypothetical protein